MICLTLASNALHLEAARRLRTLRPGHAGALQLLLWEPERCALTAADRRRWPLRLPVASLSLALLVPLALAGLVSELRLAHLRNAGRALRWIASRCRRLVLLDDGLDQYREQPRAIDPFAFPAGTVCWLFSDAPAFRAVWCRRFDCQELGPLFTRSAQPPAGGLAEPPPYGTLILDAPGVERLQPRAEQLPRPWLLLAHPVRAKRRWRLPARPGDGTAADLGPGFGPGSAERLLAGFVGTIVVGESMTLLAAARLRPPGSPLLVGLPPEADANLRRLAEALAAEDLTMELQ